MKSIKFVSLFILLILSFKSIHAKDSPIIFVSEEESIFVTDPDGTVRRPNILLFSCSYGSGHKMASQGITESLPDCDVHIVDIYQGPLKSLDPLRSLSYQFSNENLYNELARKEYNNLLNFMGTLVPKYLDWNRNKITDLLAAYLSQHSPDLVISCVPLINSMLFTASKQLEIPFMVVTTDIDVAAFCCCFEPTELQADRQSFRITVPYAKEYFNHQDLYPTFLLESFQYDFGYPTRRAFSEEADKAELDQIRASYGIHENENVILVMMGGNTVQAAKTYARLLLEMDDKAIDMITNGSSCHAIRLICLCGDISKETNRNLMMQLNGMNDALWKKNQRVRIHACPGTPHIAKIASLPELRTVISKPGGSTVNEMIKKKIPMVYHISEVTLDWERGNMEFGEDRNLGLRFHHKADARTKQKLAQVLAYTFLLHADIHKNGRRIPEAEIDFSSNLRTAIKAML